MAKICAIFLFLVPLASFGQVVNDSIVYLNEVDINSDPDRTIVRHQTKGKDCGYSSFGAIQKLVGRMDDIPEGNLKAITFYFDMQPKYVNNNRFAYYQDLEMALLLYEVDSAGLPGKSIMEKELRFVIDKHHKGEFTIDLNPLGIRTQKSIFIGLQAIGNMSERRIKIALKENNKAITYYKSWDEPGWKSLSAQKYPCWFRVSLQVKKDD